MPTINEKSLYMGSFAHDDGNLIEIYIAPYHRSFDVAQRHRVWEIAEKDYPQAIKEIAKIGFVCQIKSISDILSILS